MVRERVEGTCEGKGVWWGGVGSGDWRGVGLGVQFKD